MYKFATYSTTPNLKGGWVWQVTKDVGPANLVVARSGYAFLTEEAAIESYKEFVKWACNPPTPPTA